MIRAGIFIGVDRTGGLDRLHDAAAGARRMHEWALAQGIADGSHAKLITDAGGRVVRPDEIYDAIAEILNGPGVDQLILYFAGHGVNINRSEQWLLSEAPVRPNAAVNVSGSVELARYCGISHVVVISDACRVAPEGIQAQNVRGIDIFPNEDNEYRARPVDQFFACALGRTAAEFQDPRAAARTFSALYTGALLDALSGSRADVLEPAASGEKWWYVRPRKLQEYLQDEVPARIRARNLHDRLNQEPDAIITSDGTWVSRVKKGTGRRGAQPPGPGAKPGPVVGKRPGPIVLPGGRFLQGDSRDVPLSTLTHEIVRSAARGELSSLTMHLLRAADLQMPEAEGVAERIERASQRVVPLRSPSMFGIKVNGASLAEAVAPRGGVERRGAHGRDLDIDLRNEPALSVLLRFEEGFGTVIPAIRGYVSTLTFQGDELVDVAYEPSPGTPRWVDLQDNVTEVRALRAVAAVSSQYRRFRLNAENAFAIARRMQSRKAVDPTFAVYAAYAYHDLQDVDRIRMMSDYLRDELGVSFFDLELLGRRLVRRAVGRDPVVPFLPLLAQGWSLLAAHRVRLPDTLKGIEVSVRSSLWSLYDERGVEMLRETLYSRVVR